MKSKIHPKANAVMIDPDRLRAWAYRNRLPLSAIGPMADRCANLASQWCHRGTANYWTLDQIAFELGMPTEALIAEIGSVEELQRVSA